VVAGLAALGLTLAGVNELIVLFGTGMVVALASRFDRSAHPRLLAVLPPPLTLASAAATQAFHLPSLFLVFLKIGAVLFGSGYVLLAFLRAELVVRLGWLSEDQLLDAIAIGQVTPGPLFSTATFVGYVLGGHAGALAATLGIFIPAFFFVAVSAPLVPWLRRSATAGAFLDGVVVASLALMAAVTGRLAGDAVRDLPSAVLALVSAVLLVRFGLNSSWLVAAGAVSGVLIYGVGRSFQ
jgi:chromate transporter